MSVCEQCGEQNATDARFCSSCGAPIQAAPAVREERKVVTVLFCDLVGFTSRSEAMDVEDVRGTLRPYHEMVRRELERHGGTLEKFIGDAAMALFGAPVAHEDDPERAVRAALAILDGMRALREGELPDIHVRIGVNTGEALVSLTADPARGEGMAAGDVVNTAARLESAAPVDGVLVGESTHRATRHLVEYEPVEPVAAKGKREPVAAWSAVGMRSADSPAPEAVPETPLVGREAELGALWDALERCRSGAVQRVVLVGEPGIGKSRLVSELAQRATGGDEQVSWLRGRCLPYGDGITLWALGEVVRMQVGILHSDSAHEAERKLAEGVAAVVEDEQSVRWVTGHLRPLVGIGGDGGLAGDHRAEAFAAWRSFFEAIAHTKPAVLVIEDVHWADDLVLDFLEHLSDRSTGAMLLIVATARPELLPRRPAWEAGAVRLAKLSGDQTSRLLAGLLRQTMLPAEVQTALLERADGNPLYAHEYVRMLIDRELLVRRGATWHLTAAGDLPPPESLQATIAARLDALTPDQKSTLQAAAVMGKEFWVGSVASVTGRSRWAVDDELHLLERRSLVHRQAESTVEGETEYSFEHALVRDVAYGQIVRRDRVTAHSRAAEWIEGMTSDRDDRVELLAHHYSTALELSGALGGAPDDLRWRTIAALRAAGDRAYGMSAHAAAAGFYAGVLDLLSDDDPERPSLVVRRGISSIYAHGVRNDDMEQAAEQLASAGQVEEAAEAQTELGLWSGNNGEPVERTLGYIQRAVELVRDRPPSRAKAWALSNLCCARVLMEDDVEQGLAVGRESLAMARSLGLDDVALNSLLFMVFGELVVDDPAVLDDAEECANAIGTVQSPVAVLACENLATAYALLGYPDRTRAWVVEGQRRATLTPHANLAVAFTMLWAATAYRHGDWAPAARVIEEAGQGGDWAGRFETDVVLVRGRLKLFRNGALAALEDAVEAVELSRRIEEPAAVRSTVAFQARVLADLGRQAEAKAAIDEVLASGSLLSGIDSPPLLDLARAARRAGGAERVAEAVAAIRTPCPTRAAALAIARGDDLAVAELYASQGLRADEAEARVAAGAQLLADGRRAEGEAQLARALAFYRSVAAHAAVAEIEQVLPSAASG